MSHMQLLEVFIATIFDMKALLCQLYTHVRKYVLGLSSELLFT